MAEQNINVLDHPLVQHKLTIMRDVKTATSKFRQLLREISLLMAYEVCRDLDTELLAAPEGVRTFTTAHPDVPVYAAAVDRGLDDHGYIRPGLGDAGDRMYGTR